MKYEKDQINLEKGLQTEWIITNGIGGYSSSTILGANTRRYHGLLIAPLTPPARRFVVLSKLDESIVVGENKYVLYTNVGKEFLSEGYKYQQSFEKEEMPIFSYKVNDIFIEKIICMDYGKNTVVVYYKIKGGNSSSKLILSPIMNLQLTILNIFQAFFDLKYLLFYFLILFLFLFAHLYFYMIELNFEVNYLYFGYLNSFYSLMIYF